MWRDISERAALVAALAGIVVLRPLAAQKPVDTTKQPVDTTRKQPVILEPLEVTAAREHEAPPPVAAQEPVDTTKQPVDTTRKQPVILEPLEVTAAREHEAPPPVATINLTGAVLEHTPSSSP